MHDGVCRVFPPLHLAVNDTGVFPVAVHVVHLGHVTTVCLVDNFEKVVSVMRTGWSIRLYTTGWGWWFGSWVGLI